MNDLKPPEGASSTSARPSLRTLANRRNALKSTGPRTRAGRRRSALTGRHDLYPADLDRQLQARGEDPREFRRLYRDVAAIFQLAVETLARGTPDAAQAAPGPPASGAPEGGRSHSKPIGLKSLCSARYKENGEGEANELIPLTINQLQQTQGRFWR